jgi:phosphoglycolate phosphatase
VQRKAAIFDLDGTLLNTIRDIGDAANAVLQRQGLPTHSLQACQQFVGDGVIKLFERAIPPGEDAESLVAESVKLFAAEYEKRWRAHAEPYDGIPKMLDSLASQQIQLAVLSNKPHGFCVQCVEHHLKPWSFSRVYGQRPETPRKPDPAGLNQILDQLDLRPAECVFVGDSMVDMRTARAAGVLAVGAGWGFQPVESLRQADADVIVERPEQVCDLF